MSCAGGCAQYLLFLWALQKRQLGFGLFVSFVQNLPQLRMHVVALPHTVSLCFVTQGEIQYKH